MRLILAFFIHIACPLTAWAQISHLELGAANYDAEDGNSPQRFAVLDYTVTQLIQKYGPTGMIHLNDISFSGLNLAVRHVEDWLMDRGFTEIEVHPWLGDYNEIDLPGVKTANLLNPGTNQLPRLDNDFADNRRIARGLEHIASISETGLRITTYFSGGYNNYLRVLGDYLSVNSSYREIEDHSPAYLLPDGGNPLLEKSMIPRRLSPRTVVLKNLVSQLPAVPSDSCNNFLVYSAH